MGEGSVNLLLNTPKVSEKQVSGSKNYMDKSYGFENVLESANKSFNSQDDKKISYNETSSSFNNVKEKNNDVKVNNRKDVSYRDKNDTVQKPDTKTASVEQKENRQSAKVDDNTTPKQADQDVKSQKTSEDTVDKKVNVNEEKNAEVQATSDKISSSDKATDAALLALRNNIEQDVQKPDPTVANTPVQQDKVQQAVQTPEIKIAAEQKDTSKTSESKSDLQEQKSAIKVQPQTQQVLLNLDVSDSAKDAKPTQVQAQPKESDAKAQGLQVQANVDSFQVLTKSDMQKNIKEILEKSALTQDMLNETNAKVVSVQTVSASSSNLLSQDNAKEQGMKLALEGNSLSNAQNSVGGQAQQITFEKTLETAQQPKEINKSEILSQIHTKLEQVKDDSTTKVTIILKPENLGKVHLELVNGKDGLTASLTAESKQVKELLDKNLENLKNTLGSQGVNVNNVTVKVVEPEKTQADMFAFDQFQQGNQNQGEFEGSKNHSKESSFGFSDEMVARQDFSQSDESEKVLAHSGQVDYKI